MKTFFEKLTYKRIFRFYLAVFIVLFIAAWSNPANATTGSLIVDYDTTTYKAQSGTVQDIWGNFTHLNISNSTFSRFAMITLYNSLADVSVAHSTNSTTFTIIANGSGSGTVSYQTVSAGTAVNITWVCNGACQVTGAYPEFTYGDPYYFWREFNGGSMGPGSFPATTFTTVTNANPVVWCGNGNPTPGVNFCKSNNAAMGSYTVVIGTTVTNTYDIAYPVSGFFQLAVTKDPQKSTNWTVYNGGNTYYYDVLGTSNINLFAQQAGGIIVNMSLASGRSTIAVLNGSGIAKNPADNINPATGVGIVFDSSTYTIGGTANISWIRTIPPPFLYVDDVVLHKPDGTSQILIEFPPDVGSIKTNDLSLLGEYKVTFERSPLGLFPEILDYGTAIVNPPKPSYIVVNSTMQAFTDTNVTYFNGNSPTGINYLDISYYEPATGGYIAESGGFVFGSETTFKFQCNRITKWKFFIPPDTTKYSDCVVGSVAPYNITVSNLTLSSYNPSFQDIVLLSYEIDSTNFTGNKTYLSIYSGTSEIFNLTLPLQRRFNEQWRVSDTADTTANLRFKPGANTIKLVGRGIVLDSHVVIVNSVDSEGYGLSVQPIYCSNATKSLTYYSPGFANISFFKTDGTFIKGYNINVSLTGKTLPFNLPPGDYEVQLMANYVIKRSEAFTIGSCAPPTSTSTPMSGAGQAAQVASLISSSIFWALIITAGLMIAIAFKTQDGFASGIIGMLSAGIFSFLGWLPLWVFFSVLIIAALLLASSLIAKQLKKTG